MKMRQKTKLENYFLPLKRQANFLFKYFFIYFSTLKSKPSLFPGPQLSLSNWVIEYIVTSTSSWSSNPRVDFFLKKSLVQVWVLKQSWWNGMAVVCVTWSDWALKTALCGVKSSSGNRQRYPQLQWPMGKQQKLFVGNKFRFCSHQKSNSKD